jgi:hypothetical protein
MHADFEFQKSRDVTLLILLIGISGKIRALYIEATENLPFSCRF